MIVRDEPFLIGLAEVILLADPDPLKHFLQFLGGGGKLHPLAHKLALIVLPKIGDKGGKGIIFVVIVSKGYTNRRYGRFSKNSFFMFISARSDL